MSKSEREILVDEMARQKKARDDMQASYEGRGNARSDNARYAHQVIMNALEDAIIKIDADMEKRIAQGAKISGLMAAKPWESCWTCPRRHNPDCVMADRFQRLPRSQGGLGECPRLQEVERG